MWWHYLKREAQKGKWFSWRHFKTLNFHVIQKKIRWKGPFSDAMQVFQSCLHFLVWPCVHNQIKWSQAKDLFRKSGLRRGFFDQWLFLGAICVGRYKGDILVTPYEKSPGNPGNTGLRYLSKMQEKSTCSHRTVDVKLLLFS